ncbi:MAG TPA: glycine betaine ABC transporter substrate-binding protein [Burkholderiales bacterium]|nr:glycine betaine ABC transporter substrate-binding protein [Burkholderiales bacterium]
MSEQLALLPGYLNAHLQLTLAALLLGVLISVPLGVLVARVRWLEQPVLGVASVIQTVPSLALLAIMVPLLAAARMPSIGFLPAFIGLVLYSVLPILRNTVTGLGTVDPALIEAARGVGMTRRQRLLRVELPLAMPVVIAGIRTATVWTVGMATLSTPVGATSLGNYIFSGLQTRNLSAILVGCVAAAGLALVLDTLVRLVAVGLERRHRGILGAALAALALLYLYTGGTAARELLQGRHERIVVGAKTFTEQYILSDIIAGQIGHETGRRTEVAQSLGSTVAIDALRAGDIDVYVDYTGTIWATLMHRDSSSTTNRSEILGAVTRFLQQRYGVFVVGALGFENAYALAMRRKQAERLGITRISDLARYAPTLSIGGDYEFFGRPEWRALRTKYGLKFAKQRSMDSSLMYQALKQGNVDVISAYSTDGRIAAMDLVVLDDDRGAIPPYDALILASARLEHRDPAVIDALKKLVDKIDGNTMRRMNFAVDGGGQSPRAVANRFLEGLWSKK